MPRFQEIQRFALWVDGLMLGVGLVLPVGLWLTLGRDPAALPYLACTVPAMVLLWLALFRMKTEVDAIEVKVTFGWIPTYRRRIPLGDIIKAEPVQYNPILDYGGWGIRGIPVAALNTRGNRGVRLTLREGRTLLIGSQVPDKLAKAIRPAAR